MALGIPAHTLPAVEYLINIAAQQPDHQVQIRDEAGRVIATVQYLYVPVRPKDMPRALRPKRKLSRRQRQAATHERLGAR